MEAAIGVNIVVAPAKVKETTPAAVRLLYAGSIRINLHVAGAPAVVFKYTGIRTVEVNGITACAVVGGSPEIAATIVYALHFPATGIVTIAAAE